MKKNVAVTVIAILAAAVVALGAVCGVGFSNRDGQIGDLETKVKAVEADAAKAAEEAAAQIETLTGEKDTLAAEAETLKAEAAKAAEEAAAQIETLTGEKDTLAAEAETLKAEAAKAAEEAAAQIEALNAEAAAAAARIETMTAEAAARDEKIAALTEETAGKNQKISGLESEITGLTAAAAEKDREISELETASAELQGKVEALTAEIAEKDETIRVLNEENNGRENQAEKQPADTAGSADRMKYTEGNISFTLPASIRYDLGTQAGGQRLFSDAENDNDSKNAFVLMEIDLGMDVSSLGDAMIAVMLNTLKAEIEKMDDFSDVDFEQTTILGQPGITGGFTFNLDGRPAPAYGTVILADRYAYALFYASLEKSADEVKAEMLECIDSIALNDGSAPAEISLPDNPGLKFGMTKEDVRAALGEWDEEEDFHLGYSIVRYQKKPFRGYDNTLAIIFKDGALHLWMYGVQSEEPYSILENELLQLFGDPTEGPKSVIEVFLALDVTLTENELNSMLSSGIVVYRLWHVSGDTDCILMTINGGSRMMTAYGYLPPIAE